MLESGKAHTAYREPIYWPNNITINTLLRIREAIAYASVALQSIIFLVSLYCYVDCMHVDR